MALGNTATTRFPNASTEPLDAIAANECDSLTLAGRRFMTCFNEIERLRVTLAFYGDAKNYYAHKVGDVTVCRPKVHDDKGALARTAIGMAVAPLESPKS